MLPNNSIVLITTRKLARVDLGPENGRPHNCLIRILEIQVKRLVIAGTIATLAVLRK